MPRTRVIYVTSTPLSETIIDYYLHLLPGVPGVHARRRLTLVSCDDASPTALTRKILERPHVIAQISNAIPNLASAHMTCFTVSELERKLALALSLPIYGCNPSLLHWGSKSGSRKLFREAGVELPSGFEDIADADDVCQALAELKGRNPELRKAVVKLNEGFSGEGNAVFDFGDAPAHALLPWVRGRLPDLAFEARGMTWELYREKLRGMGGVVEEFIPGAVKRSPSAQLRITPIGEIEAVSTHDQVLGGSSGQIFLGCRFPADGGYRLDIQAPPGIPNPLQVVAQGFRRVRNGFLGWPACLKCSNRGQFHRVKTPSEQHKFRPVRLRHQSQSARSSRASCSASASLASIPGVAFQAISPLLLRYRMASPASSNSRRIWAIRSDFVRPAD
jgi:hypothetical protein